MGTGAVKGHCNPSSTNTATDSQSISAHSSDPSRSSLSQSQTPQQQPNGRTVHSLPPKHSVNVMTMACEKCSTNFTLFKRKKFCQECHRFFCSTCLPKPPSFSTTGRQCSKCRLLISGNFTRSDLQDWKVKDIRCFLDVRSVSTKGCREKHDLVELVLSQFCKERRNSLAQKAEHEVMVQQMAEQARLIDDTGNEETTTTNSIPGSGDASAGPLRDPDNVEGNGQSLNPEESNGDSGETTTTTSPDGAAREQNTSESPQPSGEDRGRTEGPQYTVDREQLRNYLEEQVREILQTQMEHAAAADRANQESSSLPSNQQPAIPRFSLEDVKTLEEIETLTSRQLKQLLVNNFVDFKGCVEKPELVLRVKRLWTDHQENKVKAERIHEADELATSSTHQDSKDESTDISSSQPRSSTTNMPIPSSNDLKPDMSSQPSASSSPSKVVTEEPSHSLCRVCMDSLTDCILLECGHMVTCTTCGKQLAECPICRQYISRVVRVFRS